VKAAAGQREIIAQKQHVLAENRGFPGSENDWKKEPKLKFRQ